MSHPQQYSCNTCGKVFKQRGHMQSHAARKRPCAAAKNTVVQQVLDNSKKTRQELMLVCKERGLKGYSGKKKEELLALVTTNRVAMNVTAAPTKVKRLNYIGSKYQLLDWLTEQMLAKTGFSGFEGKTVADLFSGTGIVAHHFRGLGASVIANDAELYSSIITKAFTRSVYTDRCRTVLESLEKELTDKKYVSAAGYITKNYSPYESCDRMFFTIDNALRIDYLRARLEELTLDEDEKAFLLASLLMAADAVSNVPAVYGCFLKNFKAKALKELHLEPIHTRKEVCVEGSKVFQSDVLAKEFLSEVSADVIYLDPPYNERQYSKNYFPLNLIAKTPVALESEPPLKGKTGIPADCFLSPFCKKAEVEGAFDTLFKSLKAPWIFLSYNSESLVGKERMLELMGKYGSATVVERDYKRFKSFEYNKDVAIKEYLYALHKA